MTQAEANRSPRPALGWGAACALTASACWLSCILPTRLAFGPWAWFQTDCEETIFASRLFAISFGAWGLIVGGAAAIGKQRGVAPAFGVAATGAVAGAMFPFFVYFSRDSLPAEVSSTLAFAVAGFLAGVVGCLRNGRRTSEDVLVENRKPKRSATIWALASALSAGGAWALTAVGVEHFYNLHVAEAIEQSLGESMTFRAGAGAAWGLLGGGLLALGRGSGAGRASSWLLGGALLGTFTGIELSLLPELPPTVPLLLTSTLAMAFAGLLAGLMAHRAIRNAPVVADLIEVTSRRERESGLLFFARLIQVLAIGTVLAATCGSLVFFLEVLPRRSQWILFPLVIVCLAFGWILIGQEVRIRELERKLRDREADRRSVD